MFAGTRAAALQQAFRGGRSGVCVAVMYGVFSTARDHAFQVMND
jgi:hypothetical protein